MEGYWIYVRGDAKGIRQGFSEQARETFGW